MFAASGEPAPAFLRDTPLAPLLYSLSWQNSIVFNLSIGYLASALFWYLVVHIPESARRRLLRTSLSSRYREFKREVVQTLVWAVGQNETTAFIDELAADHKKFRQYFETGERWYTAANEIQSNQLRMSELLLAMNLLASEVSYVLNNLAAQDPDAHRVLLGLNESITRLREGEADLYDKTKQVGRFLWGLLARFNLRDGQIDHDIIENMIARI